MAIGVGGQMSVSSMLTCPLVSSPSSSSSSPMESMGNADLQNHVNHLFTQSTTSPGHLQLGELFIGAISGQVLPGQIFPTPLGPGCVVTEIPQDPRVREAVKRAMQALPAMMQNMMQTLPGLGYQPRQVGSHIASHDRICI